MIVEVFYKGSNFKRLYDTFWNIKTIVRNGDNFCLIPEQEAEANETIVLNVEEFELRVCY